MIRLWLAFLLVLLLGGGCSRSVAPMPPLGGLAPAARLWLDEVDAKHDEVDRLLDAGDSNAAQVVLSKLLATPPPHELPAEQARVVLQDLDFRLADVELRRSAFEPALAAARHGIGLGLRDDVFGANLRIVEARSLEALGRDVEAAASYHQALVISEVLLDKELDVDDAL